MKKIITILSVVFLTATLWAQSPEQMSYQAVIREANGNFLSNHSIGMQLSILQGSPSGTAVYIERQSPSTNTNGLVTLEIGNGIVVSGDFTTIDWANGPYFLKSETDLNGGETYTIAGTSQLLSVPYALHSKTAETVTGGITETDPSVPTGTQSGEMQYWNGTAWVTVAATANEGATLQMIGGVPTWVGGAPPPQNVTNPTTGEIWMDRNLGALQVATSSTDASSYGNLYQWGRAADGHESRTSGTTSTLATSDTPGHGDFITNRSSPYDWRNPQNDNLWQGVSGINNPCPSGYRIPTSAEWEAERTSWSSNDAAGAFASPLKLPMAGWRSPIDGTITYVDSRYWSSTVYSTLAGKLIFNSSNSFVSTEGRVAGFSVRCIKD